MSITDVLEEARARIAVEDEVLRAARARRDLIKRILKEECSILGAFGSGSLAHGTQNRPLALGHGRIYKAGLQIRNGQFDLFLNRFFTNTL